MRGGVAVDGAASWLHDGSARLSSLLLFVGADVGIGIDVVSIHCVERLLFRVHPCSTHRLQSRPLLPAER